MPWLLLFFALSASMSACTQDTPTTLLLEVSQAADVPKLDALHLSVFSPSGRDVNALRLPTVGAPALPSSVVLYPPAPGLLRLIVRGTDTSGVIAEGILQIYVPAKTQTRATLELQRGRLLDRDHDGVPDGIDDCPDVADPEQDAPCPPRDGGVDSARDTSPDLPPREVGPEGPPADRSSFDALRPCTTPSDCHDDDKCTEDRCENGFCTYGAVVCEPYSGDPCRHLPFCDPKVGCVELPMPDGTPCPDKRFCTIHETCQSGTCTTKPYDCQSKAPVCTTGSCDMSKDACVFTPVASGTTCDDKNPCTQGDTCTTAGNSGISCVAPPKTVTTIDSSADIYPRGAQTIVIDSKGSVHAIYANYEGSSQRSLHYATNITGTWTIRPVDGPGTTFIETPALAIDHQDRLHAVYRRGKALIYRRWTPNSALPPLVETAEGSTTMGAAIVVDKNNRVHVVHTDDGKLRYLLRSASGTWSRSTIYTPTGNSDTTEVATITLDGGGHVHIAHSHINSLVDLDSDALWHTSNETGAWVTTTVSMKPGAGYFPSIVVDSHGAIHIAHGIFDSTQPPRHNSLGLESRPSSPTSTWTHQTLATNNQGAFASLILGAQDHLHVVFQDVDNERLLHLTNAKGSWPATATLIDSGTNGLGRWASAARGPNGRLHVIYEGTLHGPARYATFSSCQ